MKEGYQQIAAIFAETAMNEEQHAKMFFKFLEGRMVEITATYPAGSLNGTTADNLAAAAGGENEEWTDLYPAFADVADSEGFPRSPCPVPHVAKVERTTRTLPQGFKANLDGDQVFEKDEKVTCDLPQVRLRPHGDQGPGQVPGLRPPDGLPGSLRGQLLSPQGAAGAGEGPGPDGDGAGGRLPATRPVAAYGRRAAR